MSCCHGLKRVARHTSIRVDRSVVTWSGAADGSIPGALMGKLRGLNEGDVMTADVSDERAEPGETDVCKPADPADCKML